MEGWVKLHRKFMNHWLYKTKKPKTRREAWEDMIMLVNFEHSKMLIRGQVYDCGVGQSLLSLDSWAKQFNWTKQMVRTFFSMLERDQMLTLEGLQYTTRLTICNYVEYQQSSTHQEHTKQHAANTPLTRRQHAANTPLTSIKEEEELKNDKNDKNIYSEFIFLFNKITDKNFKGTKKDKGQFHARIKDGFNLTDFETAITNCKNDQYHVDNPQYLTPEFITRSDKLQKYLNTKKKESYWEELKNEKNAIIH